MRRFVQIVGALVLATAAYFAIDAVSVVVPGTQKARVRALVGREQIFNARPKSGEPATTRKIVDEVDLGVDWFTVCAGGAAAGLVGGLTLFISRSSRREKVFVAVLLSVGVAILVGNGGREPWSAPLFAILFVWLGFSLFGLRQRITRT